MHNNVSTNESTTHQKNYFRHMKLMVYNLNSLVVAKIQGRKLGEEAVANFGTSIG